MSRRIMAGYMAASATFVCGWALYWLFLMLGPIIEEHLYPVIGKQTITNVSRVGDVVRYLITIDKLRDCRVITIAYYVETAQTEDIKLRSIISVKNPEGAISAPSKSIGTGTFVLGPYEATVPPVIGYDGPLKIYGEVEYKCATPWPWLVSQVFGPVIVPTHN